MVEKLPPQKGGISWNQPRVWILSGQRQPVTYGTDSVGHIECCIAEGDSPCGGSVTQSTPETTSPGRMHQIILCRLYHKHGKRHSSAVMMRAARARIRGSIPGTDKRCSILNSVQTVSGAHPASYPVVIGGSFVGSKPAGVCSWPALVPRLKCA
jgi:hypothetical protein